MEEEDYDYYARNFEERVFAARFKRQRQSTTTTTRSVRRNGEGGAEDDGTMDA
jgi:hypothetical protein